MVKKSLKFCAIAIIALSACGKKAPTRFQDPKFPADTPQAKSTVATGEFFRAKMSSTKAPPREIKSLKQNKIISTEPLDLSDVDIKVDPQTGVVTLQGKLGSKSIELSGTVDQDSAFDLRETNPTNSSRKIKAYGECVSSTANECPQLYVDVYVTEGDKIYSSQYFVNNEVKKPEPKESTPDDSSEGEDCDPNNPDDDFCGRLGTFVGKEVTVEDLVSEATPVPQPVMTTPTAAPVATTPTPFSVSATPTPQETIPSEPITSTPVPAAPVPAPPAPVAPAPATPVPAAPAPSTPAPADPVEHVTPQVVVKLPVQSIGTYNDGSLINANEVDFSKSANFKNANPAKKASFGTRSMVELLEGLAMNILNFFGKSTLMIGDISDRDGGKITPHSSHRIGLDADISFLADRPYQQFFSALGGPNATPKFDVRANWNLLKYSVQYADVGVVFVDKKIRDHFCKNAEKYDSDAKSRKAILSKLRHWPGHGNHFHVRLRCQKTDSKCRNQLPFTEPQCFK